MTHDEALTVNEMSFAAFKIVHEATSEEKLSWYLAMKNSPNKSSALCILCVTQRKQTKKSHKLNE